MGSGGMIVADETTCMVEFAKYFMKFACDESCGKCPPCRIGSTRMLETLERITAGKGELADIDRLRELAEGMQKGSLCALGQLAPVARCSRRCVTSRKSSSLISRSSAARPAAARCWSGPAASPACPAGVDVPAYLSLIAQGRYARRSRSPRVEPVPADLRSRLPGDLRSELPPRRHRRADRHPHAKRFMADHEFDVPWTPPK
jgi:NADH-quinone oxidoreductase subunit F